MRVIWVEIFIFAFILLLAPRQVYGLHYRKSFMDELVIL